MSGNISSNNGNISNRYQYTNVELQKYDSDNDGMLSVFEIENVTDEEGVNLLNQEFKSENEESYTPSAGLYSVEDLTCEEKELIFEELYSQYEELNNQLAEAKSSNVWLSGTWDWIKNMTGLGAGSNKSVKQLEEMKKQLDNLENNPDNLESVYKNITGRELSDEELTKFLNGEVSLNSASTAGESVNKYIKGQNMCVDVVGDIVSGIVSVGAVAIGTAAGVCAAPFTAGASLGMIAAGFGIGAAAGSAVKVAVKTTDCIGNKKEYDLKDLGYDLVTGGINGAMGPVTNALGGAAGTAAMKAMGMEALETTVKGAAVAGAKEIAEEGAEAAVKTSLKTLLKTGAAKTADMMVDGGLSGATDGFARALAEGRIEDIPDEMLTGTIGGLMAAPIIDGGMNLAGKAGNILKNQITKEVSENVGEEISSQTAKSAADVIDNQLPAAGVFQDAIAPETAIRALNDDLPSDINEQLTKQTKNLTATYDAHINEAKKEITSDFAGLSSVETISGRAKSEKSVFEKLADKFKKGKLTDTTTTACSDAIGDAYGTRVQVKSLSAERAKEIIEDCLEGYDVTYEQFTSYLLGDVSSLDYETCRILNEIQTPVLELLKEEQTKEVVDVLVNKIGTGKLNITELNNYGDDISSYFTNGQLQEIADAYYVATGEKLKIVTAHDYTQDSGSLVDLYSSSEYTVNLETKGATKDSGYASSQMNIEHKFADGTTGHGELQIRGTKLNEFADAEHIPYDIRKGKIKEGDPKYGEIVNIIKDMDDNTYDAYNQYLTGIYQHLRLNELGIETQILDIKDVFKGLDTNLTEEQLNLISMDGLIKLSSQH